MSKKVLVILSGCGVYDGAEIHESVLTLLALDKADAAISYAAPDIAQHHVIDHLTGEPMEGETRNVLVESARIARGDIKALAQCNASDYDAVILPGGFGAAKNLCSFVFDGADMKVNPELETFLKAAHELGKPLGFACIAPAIAAKLFGHKKVTFTIGNDEATSAPLQSFGGMHADKAVNEIVVDENLKIVTTPAYMLAQRISEAEAGINKMVETVLKMA
ncbi:MAG: isoprenoid biosynthesis glyoxalase ElbB [Verrucomicrobiota bacterium]